MFGFIRLWIWESGQTLKSTFMLLVVLLVVMTWTIEGILFPKVILQFGLILFLMAFFGILNALTVFVAKRRS